jgi:hypothetical protein
VLNGTWQTDAEPLPVPPGCDPWRGRRDWFQYEARRANGITARHLWINTTCETTMCMSHVVILHPRALDYLPGVCVYCGLVGETKDHLLPRGWSGDAYRSWVLTVPACRECNCAIGAKWAPTITERRRIAHRAMRVRYRKYLGRPALSAADIAELGPNLRSVIDAGLAIGEVVRDRLAWPPHPLYDLMAARRSEIDDPYGIGLLKPGPDR